MDIYKGKTKKEKPERRFADNVRVTRNRLTKIPERVAGLDLYPAALKEKPVAITRKNVDATFKEFFREHKELFEIEPEDLRMVSAKKINNRWYVKYGQYYKGIPVLNATVGLGSSKDGRVSSYAANYQPDINVPTEPRVSLEAAVATAKETYKGQDTQKLREKDGILIIYPEKTEDKITYRLAWKFMIVGKKPDSRIEKYFIIDALDGEIIRSYAARFPGASIRGTVRGEIYPALPTDPVTEMPLDHQHVYIGGAGLATTNRFGGYSKVVDALWQAVHSPSGRASFRLRGPYAQVQNEDLTNYIENRDCNTSSPCDLVWSAADRDHITVFYHMNLYHDWLKQELGYSWINAWTGTSRFNARVNIPNWNNAEAGDPMGFGNNNYARSSDVVYHECTHNILYHIYGDWIGFPDDYTEGYAMDEGFADYFSCSFTNDSRHGEGTSANPRDHSNTRQYPGRSSYNSEGHTGGMIIGGACWDLRQRIIDIYGDPGARIADKLILEAHQILSTYPRAYYFSDPHESNLLSALYRAVDTDNNLLNGFPYLNDIQRAFHAHGLLQAVLDEDDSFDFSTNTIGTLLGGDLYYTDGKFYANNARQKGVTDLGNLGSVDLASVDIPDSGYVRDGVSAVVGHTYMAMAQEGEVGSYIAFRVTAISAISSRVTIRYLYRFSPVWFVANLNTGELHRLECYWVTRMKTGNKLYCQSLAEAATLIRASRYNGCHYCLPRYDADTLPVRTVLRNLDEDLS